MKILVTLIQHPTVTCLSWAPRLASYLSITVFRPLREEWRHRTVLHSEAPKHWDFARCLWTWLNTEVRLESHWHTSNISSYKSGPNQNGKCPIQHIYSLFTLPWRKSIWITHDIEDFTCSVNVTLLQANFGYITGLNWHACKCMWPRSDVYEGLWGNEQWAFWIRFHLVQIGSDMLSYSCNVNCKLMQSDVFIFLFILFFCIPLLWSFRFSSTSTMAYFFFKNGGLLVVVAKTVNTFHYLSIYLTFFFFCQFYHILVMFESILENIQCTA